jgi:hypothetical protein
MRRARLLLIAVAGVLVAVGASPAGAAPRDAGAPDAAAHADAGAAASADAGATAPDPADAGATDPGAADAGADTTATCVEHVPEGASRPVLHEDFPARGTSGYAAELRLSIAHGKGEVVLPEGFHLQSGSEAARALEKAGFVVPDPGGGVAPSIKVEVVDAAHAVTTVTIPLVLLPDKAGRVPMVLPPLPIAVGRANNEYITLCTRAHGITVEDPVGSELDPKVKPNPPPRPQREDWPLLRNLAVGVPLGVTLALCAVWLYAWWKRRPRVVPEAPRVPPWITALNELESLRRSDLLAEGRTGEYFDRVSDCVRLYLGGRYGFETTEAGYNGLETTTAEMLELLQRVRPPVAELPRIKEFLGDCDLVKFARLEPTQDICLEALGRGELIVRRTIPVMSPALPASPAGGAS